ncbi:MAG: DoxX family membrane protein [Anaerolineales bacterium]|nr:DoxX family membrane protein [Anaerolineales bacterium]
MYRFVFGILLVSHGLAHIFDFIALQKYVGEEDKVRTSSSRSRLGGSRSCATGLMWIAAAWALVGSGIGIFLGKDWWSTIAIVGAVLSLGAVIPWWNRTRRSAKLGVVLDVIIIVVLLTPLKETIFELIG